MKDEYKEECFECGHELEHRYGYCVYDPNVGLIQTDGEYWHCPACGQDEVPYETMKAVSAERKRLVDVMLWADIHSSADFNEKYIQPNEMTKILGISRQAIDQSKTLGNLIYNVTLKGVRYWLKASVERYKETGDGRFPLIPQAVRSIQISWDLEKMASIEIETINSWKEYNTRSTKWKHQKEEAIDQPKMKYLPLPTIPQYL